MLRGAPLEAPPPSISQAWHEYEWSGTGVCVWALGEQLSARPLTAKLPLMGSAWLDSIMSRWCPLKRMQIVNQASRSVSPPFILSPPLSSPRSLPSSSSSSHHSPWPPALILLFAGCQRISSPSCSPVPRLSSLSQIYWQDMTWHERKRAETRSCGARESTLGPVFRRTVLLKEQKTKQNKTQDSSTSSAMVMDKMLAEDLHCSLNRC